MATILQLPAGPRPRHTDHPAAASLDLYQRAARLLRYRAGISTAETQAAGLSCPALAKVAREMGRLP